MRRTAVLLLAALPLFAQSSLQSRQQDLDYVADQLPQIDPNFFAILSSSVYQQAVSAVQANLANLTDAQFYVNLAQLVAMPGDAHTYLYLSNAPGMQTFPSHLRWLDDGVFVTSAAAEYLQTLGAQFVAVAGVPIAQVVEQIGTVIPHENDQWLHYAAQTYLLQQQTLQGLGIAPLTASTPITFQDLDGSQFTLAVTPSTESLTSLIGSGTGFSPDYLANSSSYYWFTYLPATRILYFRYNVSENDPSNPFSSFADDLLSTLDATTGPSGTLEKNHVSKLSGCWQPPIPFRNGAIKPWQKGTAIAR
jgi:hypothetical protein